jgi:hypothetical protein
VRRNELLRGDVRRKTEKKEEEKGQKRIKGRE